ncbi:MAG: hypothetical protein LUG45_04660 [Clostridiales bacterium]|nr:hypothetical protein [Clostridiales bacterium]
MAKIDFVKKLYNGKNCYSDHMDESELQLLHIASKAESIIIDMLSHNRIVFLTGNPGDGKTFIIKAIASIIDISELYIQTDLNNVKDYSTIVSDISTLYKENKGAIVAVNEYPFMQLCKQIKTTSREIYDDIQKAKKGTIVYGVSQPLTSRIAVVDLNERNLLGADYDLLSGLIDKFIDLLNDDATYNSALKYNLIALSDKFVKGQLLSLFQLAAAECEHFAIRDILGAFAFIFTACTMEDFENCRYYSAVFEGTNELLASVQQFDPVYLSCPSLDEALWNGKIVDNWIFGTPDKYPNEVEDVEEALNLFCNLKRRYFFENKDGKELLNLQPDEITKCTELFVTFEAQKKKTKETLIRAINKLFLPSSDDKKQLHIWTTHRYDMSQDAAVAVSSKSVDASELEILMPRPADWLKGLEYIPDHIIMKPKALDTPVLTLNVDFLRTLNAVEDGYPIGLLAPQYEQAAAMFLQQLDDKGISEPNDDGEIIIASRTRSYKKVIHIQDGKYDFEEEEN